MGSKAIHSGVPWCHDEYDMRIAYRICIKGSIFFLAHLNKILIILLESYIEFLSYYGLMLLVSSVLRCVTQCEDNMFPDDNFSSSKWNLLKF